MGLSKEQIARYGRQLILPEIGVAGQERLLRASVLLIGTGGLGSPAALYLAAAGIGHLALIDRETLTLSNLHRQVLYTTQGIGSSKVLEARLRLVSLNSDVRVTAIQKELTAANALQVIQPFDWVIDGTDNFPSRYLINDACVMLGKPFVHGAVVQFRGQIMTVQPKKSACLRCVFPEIPQPGAIPDCDQAGVLGACAGLMGSLMAHEALKGILGVGSPLTDQLVVFEGLSSHFRHVSVRRDPQCAVCGDEPTIRQLSVIESTTCAVAPVVESSPVFLRG